MCKPLLLSHQSFISRALHKSSDLIGASPTFRKPSISILLTIDDDGEVAQVRAMNLDGDDDNDEIKQKIGKRLLRKLVRIGDVDVKPNFVRSEETGCQAKLDSKYDELMAALNSIVDRAIQTKQKQERNTTSASAAGSENGGERTATTAIEGSVDDMTEDKLYDYIVSIQKQLGTLTGDSHGQQRESGRRSGRQVNIVELAREILKGIGLNMDDRKAGQFDEGDDYGMARKYPIAHADEYDDLVDDQAECMSTRNLTKRHSRWMCGESDKLMENLGKRIRFVVDAGDHCAHCRRRLRRSVDSEADEELETETTEAITESPATEAPNAHLLHHANNFGIDSEEDNETAPPTTEPPVRATTGSSVSKSTIESSVTISTVTEPSVTTSTPPTEGTSPTVEDGVNINTTTITLSKNGIRVPLRLITDSDGQKQFVLDRKAICGRCKCRCKRRQSAPKD